MADETMHKLYYDGPDGAMNYEVAAATSYGESVAMEHGKHYEVPEDLAVRLLLTADWHERKGREKLAKKVKELVGAEDSRVQPGGAEYGVGSSASDEEMPATDPETDQGEGEGGSE